MFCDLVGSTSLASRLDVEDWRDVLNAYLDEASNAVARLGGHVARKLGDGLLALFGYPQAEENDAERGAWRRRASRSERGIDGKLTQTRTHDPTTACPTGEDRAGDGRRPLLTVLNFGPEGTSALHRGRRTPGKLELPLRVMSVGLAPHRPCRSCPR